MDVFTVTAVQTVMGGAFRQGKGKGECAENYPGRPAQEDEERCSRDRGDERPENNGDDR